MKKLVVGIFEDDEINRYIFENMMRASEGLEVHFFNIAESGYEMAKQIAFDLIIIEVHFWGQPFYGIEILETLKQICIRPFVSLGVTSLLQKGDFEHLITSGFTLCLEKPISYEAISTLKKQLR